jgi:hypothetical protein
MELDGDDNNDANGQSVSADGKPYQNSIIYNATVQTNGQRGMVIRRGFRGEIVNSIVAQNGTVAETGIQLDTTNTNTGATGNSPTPYVPQSYGDRLINVRNTTINGYTTMSTSLTAVTPSVATVPNFGVSTTFTPHTNIGTTGFTGIQGALFPGTSNSTLSADMLAISYTAGGFNPRPGAGAGTPNALATGTTQNAAYVKFPAVSTSYRGAFNSTATLWTTGWTAINKTNTDGIKVLVD